MALEDDVEVEVEQPARPVAWGQLVLGSVIGGVAVWSIALHLSETTPSAALAGVAESYRGWRDWLLAPVLAMAQIELSTFQRDLLAFDLVMIGALLRTALRYPAVWDVFFRLFLWAMVFPATSYLFVGPENWSPSYAVGLGISTAAILTAMIVVIGPLAGMIAQIMEPVRELDHLTAPPARFALWNALAIGAVAGALFAADRFML